MKKSSNKIKMKGLVLLLILGLANIQYSNRTSDRELGLTDQGVVESLIQILDSCDLNPDRNIKVRNADYPLLKSISHYEIIAAIKLFSDNFQIELLVYEYENSKIAMETYSKFKEYKYLDVVFKDYNFLFPSDNCLVLLRSGCKQSRKDWDVVIKKIKSSRLVVNATFIECSCGGTCNI